MSLGDPPAAVCSQPPTAARARGRPAAEQGERGGATRSDEQGRERARQRSKKQAATTACLLCLFCRPAALFKQATTSREKAESAFYKVYQLATFSTVTLIKFKSLKMLIINIRPTIRVTAATKYFNAFNFVSELWCSSCSNRSPNKFLTVFSILNLIKVFRRNLSNIHAQNHLYYTYYSTKIFPTLAQN